MVKTLNLINLKHPLSFFPLQNLTNPIFLVHGIVEVKKKINIEIIKVNKTANQNLPFFIETSSFWPMLGINIPILLI